MYDLSGDNITVRADLASAAEIKIKVESVINVPRRTLPPALPVKRVKTLRETPSSADIPMQQVNTNAGHPATAGAAPLNRTLMTMSNSKFLRDSMLSLSIPTRDTEYYISDGNTVLLVENILFKVRLLNTLPIDATNSDLVLGDRCTDPRSPRTSPHLTRCFLYPPTRLRIQV